MRTISPLKENLHQKYLKLFLIKVKQKLVTFINAVEPSISFQKIFNNFGTPPHIANPSSIQQHLRKIRYRGKTKSVTFINEEEPITSFQQRLNAFGTLPQIINSILLQHHSMGGRGDCVS